MTFDEAYFKTDAYAEVTFARYSQYWWSNRYYARLARKFGPKSGRVLEVGCGLGHLLGWLTKDYEVYGGDINPWAITQAKKNVPKAEFLLLDAQNLAMFPDSAFNIVITKHNVEHLPDPEQAVDEICRVLAPGGLLILATPNMDSPMRVRKQEKWIGHRDPTHISLLYPQEWLAMLAKNHVQPFKVYSDGFWDPPYIPIVPAIVQRVLYGAPGGLQAILGWSIIPLRLGESMIVLATKGD